MLADKISVNPQTGFLEVEGFLKGTYLNPNQIIHITGYGDYQVAGLDILNNPYMSKHKREKLKETLTQAGF